jgi:hypothetical protein
MAKASAKKQEVSNEVETEAKAPRISAKAEAAISKLEETFAKNKEFSAIYQKQFQPGLSREQRSEIGKEIAAEGNKMSKFSGEKFVYYVPAIGEQKASRIFKASMPTMGKDGHMMAYMTHQAVAQLAIHREHLEQRQKDPENAPRFAGFKDEKGNAVPHEPSALIAAYHLNAVKSVNGQPFNGDISSIEFGKNAEGVDRKFIRLHLDTDVIMDNLKSNRGQGAEKLLEAVDKVMNYTRNVGMNTEAFKRKEYGASLEAGTAKTAEGRSVGE